MTCKCIALWLERQDKEFAIEMSFHVSASLLGINTGLDSQGDSASAGVNMLHWLREGKGDVSFAAARAVCAISLVEYSFAFNLSPIVVTKMRNERQKALAEALKRNDDLIAGCMRRSLENYSTSLLRWAKAHKSWLEFKEKEINYENIIDQNLGVLSDGLLDLK